MRYCSTVRWEQPWMTVLKLANSRITGENSDTLISWRMAESILSRVFSAHYYTKIFAFKSGQTVNFALHNGFVTTYRYLVTIPWQRGNIYSV
jgi:hypothetical protein